MKMDNLGHVANHILSYPPPDSEDFLPRGPLLESGFYLGDERVLALFDLVLCVEQGPLLGVALLFQLVHPLLRRDLALQVRGESLCLLRLPDLHLNVLEFPFEGSPSCRRPSGRACRTRRRRTSRYGDGNLRERARPVTASAISIALLRGSSAATASPSARGHSQKLLTGFAVEDTAVVGDAGDEERLLSLERGDRELLDPKPPATDRTVARRATHEPRAPA